MKEQGDFSLAGVVNWHILEKKKECISLRRGESFLDTFSSQKCIEGQLCAKHCSGY